MALSDNLVAYWSLSDVNDAHGSNHLTNNNAVTFVTGKVGNAVDLENGSDQYLSIASNSDLQCGDIDFTIAAWVNIESISGNAHGIVSKSTGTSAAAIEYVLRHGASHASGFSFVVSNGSLQGSVAATNFGTTTTGTWYFVVAWHDAAANTLNICVNDGTPNSNSFSSGCVAGSAPFEIGRWAASTARDWDGLIDEVGFWKRVLTSDERTELYNGGSGRDYAYISGAGGGDVDGSTAGTSTAVGTLTGNGNLVGDSVGSSNVVGVLNAVADLEGLVGGTSTVSGTLKATGYLSGVSTGTSTVIATAASEDALSGSSEGQVTVTGTLHATGYLESSVAGTSSVAGNISGNILISGSSVGTSSVTATITSTAYLSGIANGNSIVVGTVYGRGYLSGIGAGVATVSATADIPEIPGEGVPLLSAGIWRKSQQNTILFVLTDSNGDEVVGLGGTYTLQISKIGGAFNAGAGTKSEVGLGWYKYVSTISEANTSGPVAIVVTHASIQQQNLEYVVEDRTVNAVEFTYTLTSSAGGLPISNVNVSFSVSSNPENTIWSGVTDSFGVARDLYGNLPRLTPGNYFIFSNKPGYIFEVDQELVS